MKIEDIAEHENIAELSELETAWIECLSLWKELANMPDTYTIKSIAQFKNNIIRRLGFKTHNFGCPFCTLYNKGYNRDGCPGCPLDKDSIVYKGCLTENAPFRKYTDAYFSKGLLDNGFGYHSQDIAREFYEYLLSIVPYNILCIFSYRL